MARSTLISAPHWKVICPGDLLGSETCGLLTWISYTSYDHKAQFRWTHWSTSTLSRRATPWVSPSPTQPHKVQDRVSARFEGGYIRDRCWFTDKTLMKNTLMATPYLLSNWSGSTDCFWLGLATNAADDQRFHLIPFNLLFCNLLSSSKLKKIKWWRSYQKLTCVGRTLPSSTTSALTLSCGQARWNPSLITICTGQDISVVGAIRSWNFQLWLLFN